MILRNRFYDFGPNKKHFQRLLAYAVAVTILAAVLGGMLWFGSTSDTAIQDVLRERARLEEAGARTAAGQLSRIGGVNSLAQLSLVRQHLYGLTQLNAVAASLGMAALSPQETVETAMAAVQSCEARILSSQTIEMELDGLWTNLSEIAEAIAGLS